MGFTRMKQPVCLKLPGTLRNLLTCVSRRVACSTFELETVLMVAGARNITDG